MKDEDVFASTTLTASVRECCSRLPSIEGTNSTPVFTADLKTTFFNASMKDRDVGYAEPPCGWSPETTASIGEKGRVGAGEKRLRTAECAEALARTLGASRRSWLCVKSTRLLSRDAADNEHHLHITLMICSWLEPDKPSKKCSLPFHPLSTSLTPPLHGQPPWSWRGAQHPKSPACGWQAWHELPLVDVPS